MNREDITNMAKEAGLTDSVHVCPSGTDVWIKDGYWLEELWHFATLVAAEKDKEIARLREENVYLKEVYEDLVEDRKELFDDLDKAVAAEREACAKENAELLQALQNLHQRCHWADAPEEMDAAKAAIEKAIRARGEV